MWTLLYTSKFLFRLDLLTLVWTEIITTNRPSLRSGCQIVYFNNALYLWGGSVNDTSLYKLDFLNNDWTVVNTTGEAPPPRQIFPMQIYENSAYILPGFIYDNTGQSDGCFRINLISYQWTKVECEIHKSVWAYVGVDQYMALFGGANEEGPSNGLTMVILGDPIQSEVTTKNWAYPKGRLYHSMLRSRSSLWLFGGYSEGK